MKNPKNQPAERGLALVVVVSLMALLTVMILGLLMLSSNNRSTANNDVSARQAENIAKAAVNTVIADIYDEFAIGGKPTDADTGLNVDSNTIQKVYTITNPASMVPNKALRDSTLATATGFENLVKQSASGVNFATGLDDPASPVSDISTDTASSDGRMISPATWAKAQLAPAPATNQVPQWVYLTRNGSNPTDYNAANKDATATNTDFVVGRYAYQVYDVGGLLDANVALSRASDTANGKDAKNSPYWAVAAALPGGTNALGDLLANWRHPVGTNPSTLVEWGEQKGWNEVFNNGTPSVQATASDQAFLSRQDLIAFQEANATVFPASLLPYFTHANFSLNQSSHAPDPQRPLVTAAGASAVSLDNTYNPSHMSVRSAIPAEINAASRPTVPVAARRFPLDRLNLVFPNPTDPARVLEYFGLTYSQTTREWTYVDAAIRHLDRPTSTGLQSVSSLNREPNFAELLMSTLHVGSLGGWGVEMDWSTGTPELSDARSVTFHVLQLMANIIDQWDADGYPTIIRPAGLIGQRKRFMGIEDLPRFYGIRGACHNLAPVSLSTFSPAPPQVGDPPRGIPMRDVNIYTSFYLHRPFIWNPHSPSPNTNMATTPTSFRVVANSGIVNSAANGISLTQGNLWWPVTSGRTADFTPVGGIDHRIRSSIGKPWSETNGAVILFNTSATAGSPASFRQPHELRSPGYPAGSNSSGPIYNKLTPNEQEYPGDTPTQVIGFHVAEVYTSDYGTVLQPAYLNLPGIRYDLQYQSGSNWITFDEFYIGNRTEECGLSGSPDVSGVGRMITAFYRIDPRTNRLGIFKNNQHRAFNWWGYGESNAPNQEQLYTLYEGQTLGRGDIPQFPAIVQDAGIGSSVLLKGGGGGIAANAVAPFFYQQNLDNGNGAYRDPDMVFRPAMAANASGSNGYPLDTPSGAVNSRPVILNRPFRSVAELGYVFRDQPWKQFDLNNPASADGALLEAFCLHSDPVTHEAPRIIRGRINPNIASSAVLAALFQGTAKVAGTDISPTEAGSLGNQLKTWVTTPTNRFRSKAEIIGKTVNNTTTGFTATISSVLNATDSSIQERREAVIRALADSSDTRTWNLMLDVVAQAGQLTNSATDLNQFNVRGQTHRWIFLSIDRLTGEILHQSSELVAE